MKTLTLLLTLALATQAAQLPREALECVITIPGKSPVKLSQYKGKVVVLGFILTTCSHCQATTQVLSKLQKEYGARGLQVIEGAINEDASSDLGSFIGKYKPAFPVGLSNSDKAVEMMQLVKGVRVFVPFVMFIDRKGQVRAQFTGGDPFFQDQEKNERQWIELLLAEGAPK